MAIAAPGCGDDDGAAGGSDARPQADAEAGDPDAAGGGPDSGDPVDAASDLDAASEPTLLRSGTIAVTEVAIANVIAGSPWSGASVTASFSDTTTGTVPDPVPGFETNINGCLIRIWDVGTHSPSDGVDEGALQVTGTENGDFACGFSDGQGEYLCQSMDPAIAMGSLDGVTTVSGLMTFGAAGTQTAPEMVGMYMVVQGHPTIPDGSRLPIIGQNTAADTLQVAGLPAGDIGAGDADSGFATFVGQGPVPAGGAQFLLGAADEITVSKAAGDVVDVIEEDFSAHGQGFELVDDAAMDRYLPSDVPFDGGEVNFECAGAGCGASGSGGVMEVIVIDGETTDGAVGGAPDPADPMPPPETRYATFQCAFISADTATLSAGVMAAILGTNPTRIQTSVGRYRGAIIADETGTSVTTLLQGHALLGWSDAP